MKTRLSWLSIAVVALAVGVLLTAITPSNTVKVARGSSVWHARVSPVLADHSFAGASLAVAEHHSRPHWRHWCRTHWKCLRHHWWVRYPLHSQKARRAWCRYHGQGVSCWLRGTWEQDFLTCYAPGGITANGYPAVQGIAAAGYGVPFNTRYWIPLMGMTYMVEDRGPLVADGHLDLVVNGCSDAWSTGVYWVKRLR